MFERSYLGVALCGVLCLLGRAAHAQVSGIAADPVQSPSSLELLLLPPFARAEALRTNADTPVRNTFSVNLGGPKLLELKTSYLEREEPGSSNGAAGERKLRRHFDLLATSSYLGSGLIAEGELAYSTLDSLSKQCDCDELPRMLRLGLRHRWGGLSYGADYRSFDRGFVSITGARFDRTREEGELWGEHQVGPIHIRGSIAESWEGFSDLHQLRLTRTATAALNFNRATWSGTFASSYSLAEPDTDATQETVVFTHAFIGSYRPLSTLSLTPNLSLRDERDSDTGIRTSTPTAALAVVYTPARDLLLTGGTSYTRSFSTNAVREPRTVGATAAIDWKAGRFLTGKEILSLNLRYNRLIDSISSRSSREDISAMLQLKITGF